MGNDILNKDVYLNRMRVGMYDKCWWVDKLYPEVDTVVDFGCADGSLWEAIKALCPQITKYYGIENNKELLDNKSFLHFSSIEELPQDINWNHTIVVMNSVIHEICYYQGEAAFRELFKKIQGLGVRHIAIRDMCMCLNAEEYFYLKSSNNFFYEAICNSPYKDLFIKDYCHNIPTFYGNIFYQIEFLLKYTYKENWDRERDEQYLWDWLNCIMSDISMRIEVNQPFKIVPQIRQIEKDFGIKFPEFLNTHRKMLLTKEN